MQSIFVFILFKLQVIYIFFVGWIFVVYENGTEMLLDIVTYTIVVTYIVLQCEWTLNIELHNFTHNYATVFNPINFEYNRSIVEIKTF